jgi:hypothetical protein
MAVAQAKLRKHIPVADMWTAQCCAKVVLAVAAPKGRPPPLATAIAIARALSFLLRRGRFS